MKLKIFYLDLILSLLLLQSILNEIESHEAVWVFFTQTLVTALRLATACTNKTKMLANMVQP